MANYPRIWDRNGERKIVGETQMSWLVAERGMVALARSQPRFREKVPKKPQSSRREWFFSEKEMQDENWVDDHREEILKLAERNSLTADQLRKIAAIVGYVEEVKP